MIEVENEKPIEPFFKNEFAQVPLKNYKNLQYTADIWIGDPLQKITVMFDTGSAIVYALTDLCKGCNNEYPKYNLHKNKDGHAMVGKANGYMNVEEPIGDSTPRFEYGYGSGYINGWMSSE